MKLGVVGVGLIGGSIARRARALGMHVVGVDPNSDVQPVVDEYATDVNAVATCDIVAIAAPVDSTLDIISALRGRRLHARLAFDVASVKQPICVRAAGWAIFAPTHPMAGSERSGVLAADPDLFVDRTWVYVPTDAQRDEAIAGFIASMGGLPYSMRADEHDDAMALASHLPQVVSTMLGALLERHEVVAELGGPGAASMLRLAGSPWPLWEQVIRFNRPALARAVAEIGADLTAVASALQAGDVERLASYFEGARAAYERFARRS